MQSQADLLPALAQPPLQHSNRTTFARMRNSQVIKTYFPLLFHFAAWITTGLHCCRQGCRGTRHPAIRLLSLSRKFTPRSCFCHSKGQAEADMSATRPTSWTENRKKKNEKRINGRCDKAAHARTNKGNSWEEKRVRQKKKCRARSRGYGQRPRLCELILCELTIAGGKKSIKPSGWTGRPRTTCACIVALATQRHDAFVSHFSSRRTSQLWASQSSWDKTLISLGLENTGYGDYFPRHIDLGCASVNM